MGRRDASEQLFMVGQEVAQLRSDALPGISEDAELSTVLNERLIPDLKDIANSEYTEEGYETGLKIMVSDFTDPNKVAAKSSIYSFGALEAETVKCDFLTGYIRGVLIQSDSTRKVEVTETHCRNEGHPYCLFEFN